MRAVILIFFTSFCINIYAQDKEFITVGVGYDLLSFKGDLNNQRKLTSLNNFRGGYNFFIEKRFLGLFGLSGNALFGKVSQYENSTTRNLYFESKIMQFDGRVSFYFDNKYLLGHQTLFTPFLSAGFGYMVFDPYGDLTDANGNTYYYWSDGTLRNLDEVPENIDNAQEITRDYEYETQLFDTNTNYERNTWAIPLTLGVNCKLNDRLNARVAASYTFYQTDYIDNISTDNKNDKIISTNFSLTYTITKKKEEDHFSNTDFDAIVNTDHDLDGVPDIDDHCSHTPEGVKTDKKGCPLDTDKDGIVDYLDKEPNTPDSIKHVNEFGETITDEEFMKRFMQRDSVYTTKVFKEHHVTNMDDLKEIDKRNK